MNRKLIGNLGFEKALESVKHGQKISREGWNGKGMYLIYVGGSICGVREEEDDSNVTISDYKVRNDLVDLEIERLPWIGMKTADNKFVPWLASQTDLLAEDWSVVE